MAAGNNDDENGHEPTGIVIDPGLPMAINDIEAHLEYSVWRE